MTDTFVDAFNWTLKYEGGFSDNPNDPGNWTGGAVNSGVVRGTKYGISAAAYPNLDIQNLTVADAEAIYRQDYWAKLPSCMSYWIGRLMFDAAVNHGVSASIKILQSSLNVTPDGDFGPISIAAYPTVAEIDLYFKILSGRLTLYREQRNFIYFAGGWTWRLLALAKVYAGRT